jgi:hypothetical protein
MPAFGSPKRTFGVAKPAKACKGDLRLAKEGLPKRNFYFGELGFEPRLNPPKGLVLPLHYSPISQL